MGGTVAEALEVLRTLASVRPDIASSDIRALDAFPSTQGHVWRVEFRDGTRVCLKTGSPAVVRREHDTLVALAAAGFRRAPDPLAHHPRSPAALLTSWIDGPKGDACDSRELEALGRTLRALHELPYDDPDPVPLEEAVARRLRGWLQRAAPHLPTSVCQRVADRIDPATFAHVTRTRCHRDVSPDNWIRTSSGEVCLVDFGQARPDAPLVDLAKLAATWLDRPERASALLDGYGALDTPARERLDQLVVLHGLQSAVWGREHDNAAFANLGDAILRDTIPA